MKKIISGLILAGLLLSSVFAVQAADVTITVTGRVVAAPCTVSTTSASVDLGDLQTYSLKLPGSSSAWHDVVLNLTNCPAGTTSVTALFSGTSGDSGYYRNQGTAQNIEIQLQDSEGNPLNNGGHKTISVGETTASASFTLKVRAITVNGGVTQGNIQSVINVTYTYS